MEISLKLPFDYQVIGVLQPGNRTFVTVARTHALHPFVTYEAYLPSGICEHGHYLANRFEALDDMMARAFASCGALWPKKDLAPHRFTVVGLYEESGQVYCDFVDADDAHQAISAVAHATEEPDDLIILGAFKGSAKVDAACEDSGCSAFARDLR